MKGAGLMNFELYHLAGDADLGEARGLAALEPERLARIRTMLEARYDGVRDSQHIRPVVEAGK